MPETLISERPAAVENRAIPGHWEGDLLIGLERSAIGTVVECTTKFTMLAHLPREAGYRHKERIKNGPALAGYGAIAMKDALANSMSKLPEHLFRSLTWDRGKEMSAHAKFRDETGIPVFFADPQSPRQRGTNENTNGLLRQYFPKGTDLARWSADEIEAVAHALNSRPRKTLGWRTPAEAFDEPPTVAPTGAGLHPSVEPGQYASTDFAQVLDDANLLASVGSVRTTIRWPRASSIPSRPS